MDVLKFLADSFLQWIPHVLVNFDVSVYSKLQRCWWTVLLVEGDTGMNYLTLPWKWLYLFDNIAKSSSRSCSRSSISLWLETGILWSLVLGSIMHVHFKCRLPLPIAALHTLRKESIWSAISVSLKCSLLFIWWYWIFSYPLLYFFWKNKISISFQEQL